MLLDRKYGTVHFNNTMRDISAEDVQHAEPVFVIRGKDVVAPGILREYAEAAREAGASEAVCQDVFEVADAMETWQAAHPDLVKVAD